MSTFSLESAPFPADGIRPTEPTGPAGSEDTVAIYIDQLLKSPAEVRAAIKGRTALAARTRTYVQVLVACTAVFGASLGFYRGGLQVLFAAIKLPIVTLLTLAVAAPLLYALNRALERPADMAREVAQLVASLARGALVLAAELPLIWAAHAVGVGYHRLILLTVLSCGIAGLVSFWFLWKVISVTKVGCGLVAFVVLATMCVVGAQASWLFRPFLVRPRATSVVFMHPLEGSFSDAIGDSLSSAQGHYRDDVGYESRSP
jgi:hypothetical protein